MRYQLRISGLVEADIFHSSSFGSAGHVSLAWLKVKIGYEVIKLGFNYMSESWRAASFISTDLSLSFPYPSN